METLSLSLRLKTKLKHITKNLMKTGKKSLRPQ